jgi:hypothetical protein
MRKEGIAANSEFFRKKAEACFRKISDLVTKHAVLKTATVGTEGTPWEVNNEWLEHWLHSGYSMAMFDWQQIYNKLRDPFTDIKLGCEKDIGFAFDSTMLLEILNNLMKKLNETLIPGTKPVPPFSSIQKFIISNITEKMWERKNYHGIVYDLWDVIYASSPSGHVNRKRDGHPYEAYQRTIIIYILPLLYICDTVVITFLRRNWVNKDLRWYDWKMQGFSNKDAYQMGLEFILWYRCKMEPMKYFRYRNPKETKQIMKAWESVISELLDTSILKQLPEYSKDWSMEQAARYEHQYKIAFFGSGLLHRFVEPVCGTLMDRNYPPSFNDGLEVYSDMLKKVPDKHPMEDSGFHLPKFQILQQPDASIVDLNDKVEQKGLEISAWISNWIEQHRGGDSFKLTPKRKRRVKTASQKTEETPRRRGSSNKAKSTKNAKSAKGAKGAKGAKDAKSTKSAKSTKGVKGAKRGEEDKGR